jgi:hypothetical protein
MWCLGLPLTSGGPSDASYRHVGTVTPDMMFSKHGLPHPAQDWRAPRVGLRPQRGVLGPRSFDLLQDSETSREIIR